MDFLITLLFQVIRHPNYGLPDYPTYSYDFALLVLETPFDVNENVAPVCAPVEDVDYGLSATAGFGSGKLYKYYNN